MRRLETQIRKMIPLPSVHTQTMAARAEQTAPHDLRTAMIFDDYDNLRLSCLQQLMLKSDPELN